MSDRYRFPQFDRFTLIAVLSLIAIGLGWLYFAPPGLLGKADAVGYAVCHRIESRSFLFGERQLPLCARCSGMYLGALVSILLQLNRGRYSGFPPIKILVVLGIFFAAFAIDGVNSYLHLFPNMQGAYEPINYLRLLTGTGLGIGMGAVLMPVLHQSYWSHAYQDPLIRGWRDFGLIILCALVTSALILTDNPLILYPLAVLSAFSVLLVLGLIYSMVWMMLFKKDNSFTHWKEIGGYVAAGFALAIFQILAIDLVRFYFTQSWSGINFS